jgi:cyanophycinase-like exopeptidase
MSGPVALHGGGEFTAGDEPCLEALLELAAGHADGDRAVRIAVVPTAASRWDPEESGAHGVAAFGRVAAVCGLAVAAAAVMILDAASAADPDLAAPLAEADLIYFPGGDPDVIVTVMPGTLAWAAIQRAHRGGAILGGASAGAMALAPWTWTPDGGAPGLDVVAGLAVRPHADAATWEAVVDRFGAGAPSGLGVLGIPERTAAISDDVTADPITWRVVGEGEVRWRAVRGGPTIVSGPGSTLTTKR